MKNLKKWLFVIYPLLLAMFFILALYSANVAEVSPSEIVIPLIAALGFALLLLLLALLLIGLILKLQTPSKSSQPYQIWDLKKAAIVVSIFLVLFFTYGHALDALMGGDIAFRFFLLIGYVALFTCGAYFVVKTRKDLRKLTIVLNIVAVTLVMIPTISIVVQETKSASQYAKVAGNVETDTVDLAKADTLPDIYYIILDRYASARTLEEVYDFDNSEFLDYLSDKGFYVANESRANYTSTYDSLASSLNLDFIHDEEATEEWTRVRPWQLMLQDYTVWRSLKSVGYQFIHYGSWYEPTRENPYADINHNSWWIPEFSLLVFRTTMAYPFCVALNIIDDMRIMQWKSILYNFNNLAEIPNMKEPTYVFAHMLIPHHPYVFDREGNYLTLDEAEKRSETVKYVDQLIAANNMLRVLIDELLSSSDIPPIIILQADEGTYPGGQGRWEGGGWEEATEAELRQKMGILNAYYLPNVDSDVLYPSITPVNSFRLVFNLYFNTDLELLPDKSYAPYRGNPDKFFDITHKLEYD